LLVALLVEAMKAIGQHQIASFLPFVALGMPARYWRLADIKTASPYFRLALAGSGTPDCRVRLGHWVAGRADRARLRRARMDRLFRPSLVAESSAHSEVVIDEPLRFGEVARYHSHPRATLHDLSLDQIAARRVWARSETQRRGPAADLTGMASWKPYVPHHFGRVCRVSASGP
jgi:hypothetical protein